MKGSLVRRALAASVLLVIGLIVGIKVGSMLFTSTITWVEVKTVTSIQTYSIVTTITATKISEKLITKTQLTRELVREFSTTTKWMIETETIEHRETITLRCESGYLITSYWTVREEFYRGEKVLVRDSSGKLLGYYRSDFLEDVMVEGWGKGDGIGNDGSYLGYDPELGFIKSPEPLDAYGSPLIPWKTVAALPHLRKGTIILIIGFTSSEELSEDVIDKLLTSRFTVSDRGGLTGRHIDIYIGEQDRADMNESPYALYIQNATICLLL